MSVKIRDYEGKRVTGHQVDLIVRFPTGQRHRERKVLTNCSRAAARNWGQQRERHLLLHGLPVKQKEVPTLKEFAPRFIDGYAKANRQKPSTVAAKEMILRLYLIPALGHKRLDAITNEDVQRLKESLQAKSPKT